jgi:hypothetical protein
MSYQVEFDIPHTTSQELVNEFATGHGCVATLVQLNGPAGGNPLYHFSSDKFSYLEELIGQVLGYNPDEEALKTMVWEV